MSKGRPKLSVATGTEHIEIFIEGYGGAAGSAIMELDYDDDGDLRLTVWADKDDESPTDIIPLRGALLEE